MSEPQSRGAESVTPAKSTSSVKLNRRRWLKYVAGGAIAGAVGVGVYTWRIEPHWLEFVVRDLPVAGLSAELDGRRLVHISDIHVGHVVDDQYLIHSFQAVKELAPDLVALTGDYITCAHDGSPPLEQARRVYSHLPTGRLGTVGILGNHDYGPAWSRPEIADKVCDILSEQGCQMLRSDEHIISGLRILGTEDFWGPNFSYQFIPRMAKSDLPTLVLCHNPDAVDLPGWGDYRGWILSGHTHGGQCKPPFLPPPLLPVKNRRYTCGEFDLYDGRRLYISRGLGYLKRLRFNVRPEITVFTLRRA